jgi:hypothetical protein
LTPPRCVVSQLERVDSSLTNALQALVTLLYLIGKGAQPGEGRDQRAYARGDTYRGIEDVVDHQCRGGQQAGVRSEVLRRDRIAAAAVG